MKVYIRKSARGGGWRVTAGDSPDDWRCILGYYRSWESARNRAVQFWTDVHTQAAPARGVIG